MPPFPTYKISFCVTFLFNITKMDYSEPIQSSGIQPAIIMAAVKLQKVYRSYRTRRRLADSAIVSEELWWQAIEYARLNHTTTAFFNHFQPEKAASRWSRVGWNASKVGKGLGKDAKARKMAFQHWIEAIDPRHRYGHNLTVYFEEWYRRDTGQPFFYWLDVGDGKELDLEECPKSRLRQQCVTYLGPQEREHCEYTIVEGEVIHKITGDLLDTQSEATGSKWIFVMSTSQKLYVGKKSRGLFHHSSFLAGGATLAAGRLEAKQGKLKSVSPYSGHYRPTEENLSIFLAFLQKNGVNLEEVQASKILKKSSHRYDIDNFGGENNNRDQTGLEEVKVQVANTIELKLSQKQCISSDEQAQCSYENNPSILERRKMGSPDSETPNSLDSNTDAKLYEFGSHRLLRWKTGAGLRLGCASGNSHQLKEHAIVAMEVIHVSEQKIPVSLASGCYSQ